MSEEKKEAKKDPKGLKAGELYKIKGLKAPLVKGEVYPDLPHGLAENLIRKGMAELVKK